MPRVQLEISDRIAKLTLCRPEKLNAIDRAMLQAFEVVRWHRYANVWTFRCL